jgi:hypothetical protein
MMPLPFAAPVDLDATLRLATRGCPICGFVNSTMFTSLGAGFCQQMDDVVDRREGLVGEGSFTDAVKENQE